MSTNWVGSCVPTLSLRAQRGNRVAAATAVRRRAYSLIGIATSLALITMTQAANRLRPDNRKALAGS